MDAADLVVLGAVVRTPAGISEAVAVRGDRICALGDAVAGARGPRTRVVEATGGLVLPGFQDAHVHAPFAGRNLRRIWLNDLTSRQEYLERVARYAAEHPDEEWLTGGGWSMDAFPRGLPRKEDLDRVVPDRPVFLFNRDVHGAWANSAALERAGITKHTPDPSDGRIERDPHTGEPTGALHEGAAYSFEFRWLPLATRAEWEDATLDAQRHLHAVGITGWQDAWVTPDTLAAYRSLAGDGRLTARVVGSLWWDRHRGLEQIDDFLDQRELGAAGSFHPTNVKIMIDGVLENYTGALTEPYCDGCGGHTDNHGLTYVDQDVLVQAVTELDRLGFGVHMHAIGDRAVKNGLDAVAAARRANGVTGNRHHLAHIQLIRPEDVPRFAELDVTANCQAYWAQADVQMEELTVPFLGRDRAERQYAFADLVRSGARLAMGSDWSVSTPDPLQQIEVAVTRRDPGSPDQAPFLPEQALPLAVAVDAFTAGSAYVNGDDDAGRVELGARADLVVLDRDIFEPGVLPTHATVTHTVAAGRVVYDDG